jgi:hypothetical protein
MKTLRDTNNNNSNITNNTTQQHFITPNGSLQHNSPIVNSDNGSLLTQNRHQQQTIWRSTNGKSLLDDT